TAEALLEDDGHPPRGEELRVERADLVVRGERLALPPERVQRERVHPAPDDLADLTGRYRPDEVERLLRLPRLHELEERHRPLLVLRAFLARDGGLARRRGHGAPERLVPQPGGRVVGRLVAGFERGPALLDLPVDGILDPGRLGLPGDEDLDLAGEVL